MSRPPSSTPLFEQTLSDVLLSARRRVEEAERRASLAERRARVQQALITQQAVVEAEDRVRAMLALDAPALPELAAAEEPADPAEPTQPAVRLALAVPPEEPVVPSVPPVDEVFRSNPGVARFLDSLLGPSVR